MAILKMIRAPQPKAYYPGPGNTIPGTYIGNALPANFGSPGGFAYVPQNVDESGAGAFAGGVTPALSGGTAGFAVRWGRLRGGIVYYVPIPPPPPPG